MEIGEHQKAQKELNYSLNIECGIIGKEHPMVSSLFNQCNDQCKFNERKKAQQQSFCTDEGKQTKRDDEKIKNKTLEANNELKKVVGTELVEAKAAKVGEKRQRIKQQHYFSNQIIVFMEKRKTIED